MAPSSFTPTDPLEVLCDNATAAIRRYVARLHAEVADWQLGEYDSTPAHGYQRPTRRGWAQ